MNNAENRNRTGTVVTYRRILSPVRLPVPPPRQSRERKTGFEPATPTLARWCSTTELLPHVKYSFTSLNETCYRLSTLKAFLLSQIAATSVLVRVKGVEPPRLAALDPKSSASANSATPAK